jgi:hypothetical protein
MRLCASIRGNINLTLWLPLQPRYSDRLSLVYIVVIKMSLSLMRCLFASAYGPCLVPGGLYRMSLGL